MPYVLSLLLLLSDASTDSLSGGAGWVGAGLLGAVLAWLMFVHLPAKDKQVTSLIEGRNELARDLQNRYAVSVKELQSGMYQVSAEQRSDHKNVVQMVIDHCQRETMNLNTTMTKALDEVTQAVIDLRRMMEERSEHKRSTS